MSQIQIDGRSVLRILLPTLLNLALKFLNPVTPQLTKRAATTPSLPWRPSRRLHATTTTHPLQIPSLRSRTQKIRILFWGSVAQQSVLFASNLLFGVEGFAYLGRLLEGAVQLVGQGAEVVGAEHGAAKGVLRMSCFEATLKRPFPPMKVRLLPPPISLSSPLASLWLLIPIHSYS